MGFDENKLEEQLIAGVRREGLKQMLVAKEQEIRVKESRRRLIFRVASPVISLAACMAVGFFVNISRSNCIALAPTVAIEYSRGGEANIAEMINAGELDLATYIIEELLAASEEFDTTTEEGAYHAKMQLIKVERLSWYEAVVSMKRGRFVKAKRQLREIADNGGRYSKAASELLQQL